MIAITGVRDLRERIEVGNRGRDMWALRGFREHLRNEPALLGRWRVYDHDANRWMNIVYESREDAEQAAERLTKTL